jgi:hypothetical protein
LFALLINLLPFFPGQPRQLADELGTIRERIDSDVRRCHCRICFAVATVANVVLRSTSVESLALLATLKSNEGGSAAQRIDGWRYALFGQKLI